MINACAVKAKPAKTRSQKRRNVTEVWRSHTFSLPRGEGLPVWSALASFPGLLPPSPLRMLASDNYAWVYYSERRLGIFYHVMRAATVIKRHRAVL